MTACKMNPAVFAAALGLPLMTTAADADVPVTSFVPEAQAPTDLNLTDPALSGFRTSLMVTDAATDWTNARLVVNLHTGTIRHLDTTQPLPQGAGDTGVFHPDDPTAVNAIDLTPDDFIAEPDRFAASWFNTDTTDTGQFAIAAVTLSDDAFGFATGLNISGGDADAFTFRIVDGGFAPLVAGDLNGDGTIDGLDIDPFVQVLTGGRGFDPAADLNGDGTVDGLDIDPFVQTLTGGADTSGQVVAAMIPEPGSLLLLVGGVGALGLARRSVKHCSPDLCAVNSPR